MTAPEVHDLLALAALVQRHFGPNWIALRLREFAARCRIEDQSHAPPPAQPVPLADSPAQR